MTHERSQGRANVPTAQLQNSLLKLSRPTPSCPQSSAAAPVLPASVRLPVPHNSRERNHTEHNVPEAHVSPFQGQELFPCVDGPQWVVPPVRPRTCGSFPPSGRRERCCCSLGSCSFCLDTCVRFPGARAGVEWLGHLVALCLPPPPPSPLPTAAAPYQLPAPQELRFLAQIETHASPSHVASTPHSGCRLAATLQPGHRAHPAPWGGQGGPWGGIEDRL